MIPIAAYKYIAGLAILVAIAFAGYGYGYSKASDHYAPIVASKQAALDKITADTQAKIKQQENDNAQLKKDADARTASITAYYQRMFNSFASHRTGTNAVSHKSNDGTSGQSAAIGQDQTITGCPVQIEQNCALDAERVNEWRDWCIAHRCPVSGD